MCPLRFHAGLGALYRSLILYVLPISVHRPIVNAFNGKTNLKPLRPGQQQGLLTPASFNEGVIWNETGNRLNAI